MAALSPGVTGVARHGSGSTILDLGPMSSTAITESNTKTTVIVPYPEGAQVQAELEKWQEALELYAMENKFGPALTDASSRMDRSC